MKVFIVALLLVVGYGSLLLFTARSSTVVQDEAAWFKECDNKGGMILPRTTICVKKEVLIEQDRSS